MTRLAVRFAMSGVENPYQPPGEEELPAPTAPRQDLYPLAPLANICLRLYLVTVAYGVVQHLYDTLLGAPGERALPEEIGMTPSRLVEIALDIANLASAIVYLMWKYRAAANARILDAQAMKTSPGMAVGGYFIPVANLVLPCLAMRGIARASRVEMFWVTMWWACYLAILPLVIVLLVMSIRVEQSGAVSEVPWPPVLDHLAVILGVVTYFFSWQIVTRVTRAQMTAAPPEGKSVPA